MSAAQAPHGWGTPADEPDGVRHVLGAPWEFHTFTGNPDSWHEQFRASRVVANAWAVCGRGLQLKTGAPDGAASKACRVCVTPGAPELRWARYVEVPAELRRSGGQ